jgi:hypothetical protein
MEFKSKSIKGEDFRSLEEFNKDVVSLTIFRASIISGELTPGKDVLDARWFSLKEIGSLPLRGNWMKFFLAENNGVQNFIKGFEKEFTIPILWIKN